MFAVDFPPEIPAVADLSPEVAQRAARAAGCTGERPRKLLIVDMSRPSSEPRLWAYDVSNPRSPRLLTRDWVAHGAGSDPGKTGLPSIFGAEPESGRTSLGLYRVAERYKGVHGGSYRLDGLSSGWNDTARDRAVVLHPAGYVRPGRVGRSLGCPAVRHETLADLEAAGFGSGALIWIDGPGAEMAEVASCPAGACRAPSTPWPTSTPAGMCMQVGSV